MGASPKTTEFLKECMADSLLLLMRQKPFAQITINEIAQTAGVNRSTWFRNFETKNDALIFKVTRLWFRWADEHGLKDCRRYTLDNAGAFFEFCDSIRDILGLIYHAELQSIVYESFYQVMMPQYGASSAECYEARFYSYGLFGLLEEWVKRDFFETPAQLTAIFRKMMNSPGQ